jgi:simple sugar transport system ATP-binding protein
LKADQLTRTGAIEAFDLDLHAGEVIGLAGLLGSGRTEIAQLFFGVDHPSGGTMRIDDDQIKESSPLKSISRGIALCPEDRKDAGIIGELTVRENIILAMQAGLGWFKYLKTQEQYAIAEKYIKILNIATPSPDQPVKNLSGGNQQKVILARWLAINPRLLILDEPTRGIDVGAKLKFRNFSFAAEEGKS